MFYQLDTVNPRSGFLWNIYQTLEHGDSGLDILVIWEMTIDKSVHRGVNFQLGLKQYISPKKSPVHIVIEAPQKIMHNFESGKLLLPVRVYLKNLLENDISVIL